MNAIVRAVLATLVAASGTAALADSQPGGYVSGALGQSHLNLDCEDTTSCRRTSTGLKVTGGYAFGNGLSAEVGYIHFGRAKASGPVGGGEFEAVWRSHATTAGAAFDAEFTKEWGMTASAPLT